MIRREVRTTDGQLNWLLVSQVEHARVSGVLATQWRAADLSPYEYQDKPLQEATTKEILAAVTHHDDGWAQWETCPRIDPAHGRPYSFMSELPLEESLVIWSNSIDSARHIGPLAGWLVAGHFSELLSASNHQRALSAVSWLDIQRQRRHEWFSEWQQASGENTSAVAERGLRLLQACDFLSLWLCCECPVMASEVSENVPPFIYQGPNEIYEFSAQRQAGGASTAPAAPVKSGWLVEGAIWPFEDGELQITIDAWLTPARQYTDGGELLATRRAISIGWLLSPSPRRRWLPQRPGHK